MTATHTRRIYDVPGKYFGNQPDAHIVVTEIEQIVENKFEERKQTLATKEDLLKFQIDVEKRFNQQVIWIIATGMTIAGIIIAVIKL